MLDMDRYKSNGKICRENIALDIRDRRILHNDILAIIEDPEIARTFFGTLETVPQKYWNKGYLDKLSYDVASVCFNADYLLYLETVANYLIKKKSGTKLLIGGAVMAAVIVIFFIAAII